MKSGQQGVALGLARNTGKYLEDRRREPHSQSRWTQAPLSVVGGTGQGWGHMGLFLLLSLKSQEGEDLGLRGRHQAIPGAPPRLQWEGSQFLGGIELRAPWEA